MSLLFSDDQKSILSLNADLMKKAIICEKINQKNNLLKRQIELKKLDEKRDERKARKLQNKIELNEVRIEVADKELKRPQVKLTNSNVKKNTTITANMKFKH